MRHLFGLIVAGLLVLTWAPVHAQDSIPLSERTKTTDCQVNDGLPDPSCTPGAIDPRVTQDTIGATICVSGYTRTVRPSTGITDRIKREQYAAYGLQGLSMSASELDHLVPLELGGAPADVANLWPEVYEQAWGARVKDRIENKLHDLVCSGQIPLADAQQAIAADWKAAYAQYVGAAGPQSVAPEESDDADQPDDQAGSPPADQPSSQPAPSDQAPSPLPPPAPAPQPAASGNCSPSYPDFCIPPPPPDLNCNSPAVHGRRNFTVLPPDPHRFNADHDGVGCESRR